MTLLVGKVSTPRVLLLPGDRGECSWDPETSKRLVDSTTLVVLLLCSWGQCCALQLAEIVSPSISLCLSRNGHRGARVSWIEWFTAWGCCLLVGPEVSPEGLS